MFFRSSVVLNPESPQPLTLDQPIDIALTLAMADLKARFIDIEKGVVQYKNIRGSEPFERYKALTGALQSFDPGNLETRERRLSLNRIEIESG